ncbi:hypothetical protein ACWV26_07940 [Rummeliibacillus sp. JY-2-4R]
MKNRHVMIFSEKFIFKRILPFLALFLLLFSTSAFALSWSYPFVSWNGRVYEVTDLSLGEKLVGKKIGEVEAKPNEETGKYQGNASNEFDVGTEYYQLNDKNTDQAIAVKVDGQYLQAVYKFEQANDSSNMVKEFSPGVLISCTVAFVLLCVWFFWSLGKARRR